MSLLTSFDAINVVYQTLVASPVQAAITGGIYKMSRPDNATDDNKEDIVVNSLGLPNKDVQQGIVNINIHVPNLPLVINGRQDNSQPDFIRMHDLAIMVIAQVKEIYNDGYWFFYQQDNIMQGDDTEHIVNIRIEFYNENF